MNAMKTWRHLGVLGCMVMCCLIVLPVSAQTTQASSPTGTDQSLPQSTTYQIANQGANNRIWERITYERAPDGRIISKKHHYTELATGLNYLKNGQWVESKEEIDSLPNGGAAATQGQHQVYFPGDIYQGVIEVVTPDGIHLKSRPMGISYDDGTNTVLIAVLTNSIGQLVAPNKIVYPDAFTGLKADLVCTYRKGGFESDVVFQEQPPTPEQLGLNSANVRLQSLTEFFDTPEPSQFQTTSRLDGLADSTLKFGNLVMGRGKAFALDNSVQSGTNAPAVRVYKSWQSLEGRTFLVEETPYLRIEPALRSLPSWVSALTPSANSLLHKVSASRLLTPVRLVQKNSVNIIQLAKADLKQQRGVVLDYVELDSAQSDYTFQADTTYYISGQVSISGTTTIEGGTVIKFDQSGTAEIDTETVDCKTSQYRPAIFTAQDDDTVGEPLPSSSGTPSGYYGNIGLYVDAEDNITLSNLRFNYQSTAMYCWSSSSDPVNVVVRDIQILNGLQGFTVESYNGNVSLYCYNGLIANLSSGCFGGDYWGGGAQNLTAVNCYFAGDGSDNCQGFTVSNSILVNIPDHLDDYIGVSGGYNLFYNSVEDSNPSCTSGGVAFNPYYETANWPFQTVGAGSYYLATNSPYRNLGSTNIDATLLSELRQRTTYPPVVYSNTTISVATTFSPQAWRDTNAAPDLGYHYDPLDYVFGGTEAQSNITFTAGTEVGWFDAWSGDGYGIILDPSVTAAFNGIVTSPCWLARYDMVQEGGNGNWTDTGYLAAITAQNSDAFYSANSPQLVMKFTKFSSRNYNDSIRDDSGNFVVNANDCEFYGGIGGYNIQLNFTNCLFYRYATAVTCSSDASPSLFMQNCTTIGGGINTFTVQHFDSGAWPVFIKDCAFDGTSISADTLGLTCDYNSFLTNDDRLPIDGAHDVILISSYDWQSSWFGDFYLPTNSPLIDAGHTTADQVGLYHFTTQTNQVKEASSIVDIGYHYVATDTNGVPIDSNGDGIPDYLEDANGDGITEPGESSFGITIETPVNGSVIY
jgi:hypothetical protein